MVFLYEIQLVNVGLISDICWSSAINSFASLRLFKLNFNLFLFIYITRNTCTENNTMIVSERISPNLSETPIREIVAHVIDNGAHCDTSREDDDNTNRQMVDFKSQIRLWTSIYH
jgi:hypothetical protein